MAISNVLKYLVDEINDSIPGPGAGFASLGNIARLDSGSAPPAADSQGNVIVTLVNIEEENTLKNSPFYVRSGDSIKKRNPILYLNLYVLISSPTDPYETALDSMSQVIQFFQGKNVFTAENDASGGFSSTELEKIVLELCTLNFEQINHLWGIMGGKYLPSVIYKLRLVPIQSVGGQDVQPIEEIEATGSLTN